MDWCHGPHVHRNPRSRRKPVSPFCQRFMGYPILSFAFYFRFFPANAHMLLKERVGLALFTSLNSSGVRKGCHYLIGMSVFMCNIRRFYWLRELYDADFHEQGINWSGRVGLTRGTCFVASRLEVVAGPSLLWKSWCILGTAGFRVFFSLSFSLERTRPVAALRYSPLY